MNAFIPNPDHCFCFGTVYFEYDFSEYVVNDKGILKRCSCWMEVKDYILRRDMIRNC